MDARICPVCRSPFTKPKKLSWQQWDQRTYCSMECQSEANHHAYLGRGVDLDAMRAAHKLSFREANVEYGYCQCGCGSQTRISKQTSTREGVINGEPVRFCKGHAARLGRKHIPVRNRQMVTAGTPPFGRVHHVQ